MVDRSVAILRRRALLAESLTRRRLRRWRSEHSWEQVLISTPNALLRSGWMAIAAESAVGPFKGDTDIGMRRILDSLDTVAASVSASPASDMNVSNHAVLFYTVVAIRATSKLPFAHQRLGYYAQSRLTMV